MSYGACRETCGFLVADQVVPSTGDRQAWKMPRDNGEFEIAVVDEYKRRCRNDAGNQGLGISEYHVAVELAVTQGTVLAPPEPEQLADMIEELVDGWDASNPNASSRAAASVLLSRLRRVEPQ